MNELALFAGAGGGILGGLLLGWRTVCAVELDAYARRVLLARQRDGVLERFPIWDDVRTFDGRPWRGHVDVVSGGFPCQPFSTASRGRRVAEDLWPEMRRIIGEVAPRHVLAENVQPEPIELAAGELAEMGFRCTIISASAADLGAPHNRPRFWLAAHADEEGEPRCAKHEEVAGIHGVATVAPWSHEPRDMGVDDGMAYRMDRLGALGNGQVPCVVRAAWEAGR